MEQSGPTAKAPESLHGTLAAMHKQWRRVLFWRGLARLIWILLVSVTGLCVVDGVFQLSFLTRLVLVAMVLAGLAGMSWRTWVRYWIRPYSPKSMAWILEAIFPDFHERLISAVELESQGLHVQGISEKLIFQALSEAEEEVQSLSPSAVFPMRWRVFRLPGVWVAALMILLLIPGLQTSQRLSRMVFPSPRDASLGPKQLVLEIGARTRDEGDTVYCRAHVKRGTQKDPELVVDMGGTSRFVMEPGPVKGWYIHALPDVKKTFAVWAVAGDIRSRTYTVTVRPRPKIIAIDTRIKSPVYTGAPIQNRTGLSGDIRALAGSRVTVRVHSDQKLASFRVTHDGERIFQQTGDLGDWVDFPMRVVKDGHYTLSLANKNGLRNPGDLTYSVKSLPDLLPEVHVSSPVKDQHVEMNQDLPVFWEAWDDYGIVSQTVIFQGAENMVIQTFDLEPDQRAWSFTPEKLGMRPGMTFFLSLSVSDEAGQSTETPPVKIQLGGGKILDDLDAYLTLCDQLELTLQRIQNELQAVATYSKYLESFEDQTGEDSHYRLMRDRKVDIIGEALRFGQTVTLAMMPRGTFPKSSHYAELLKLYQEQEMLFSLPELKKRSPEPALDRLDRMVNLEMNMARLLKEKGRQHQWKVLLPLKMNAIQAAQVNENPDMTWDRLALIDTELSADFKTQFSHFPDQTNVAKLDIKDALKKAVSALQAAVVENARRFANMGQLDRLATAIEKELLGLEKQLRFLAEELKQGGSDQQWLEARDLAENYANIATSETDPVRRADMELVASGLTTAVAKRQPWGIEEAARALTVLQVDNRLAQLKNKFKKAQLDGRLLERAMTHSPATDPISQQLIGLIRVLGNLETDANTLGELDPKIQLAPLSQAVHQVVERLSAGAKIIQSGGDIMPVAKPVATANHALKEGFDSLYKHEGGRRRQADAARSKLIQASAFKSDRLGDISETLYGAAIDLSLPAAPIASVSEKLAKENKKVNGFAENFRDEAARDLALDRSSSERILEKIVLANALDETRRKNLVPAREFLEKAAMRLSGNTPGDIQDAGELLTQAAARIGELAHLTRLHERVDLGWVSNQDAEVFHATIMSELNDVLPDNLPRVLEIKKRFTANEIALKKITAARSPATDVEKQKNAGNQLREKVVNDLRILNPGMLQAARRTAVNKAQQALIDLRRHLVAGQAAVTAQAAAEDFVRLAGQSREAANQVMEALAGLDAIMRTTHPDWELLNPGFKRMRPRVEAVIHTIELGKPPLTGFENVTELLTEMTDRLVAVSTASVQYPVAGDEKAPSGGGEPMEVVKKTLADTEAILRQTVALETAMRNLESASQTLRDQAANTMAAAVGEVSQNQTSTLKQLSESFTNARKLKGRRGVLAAVEKEFPGGSDMAARLHKARSGLEKAEKQQDEIDALGKIIAIRKRKLNQSIQRLESSLSKDVSGPPDTVHIPLANLKANVDNGSFHSALKNLLAINRTLNPDVPNTASDGTDTREREQASSTSTAPIFFPQTGGVSPALTEGMKGAMALGRVAGSEPALSKSATRMGGTLEAADEAFENAAVLARQAAVAAMFGTGEADQKKKLPDLTLPDIPSEPTSEFKPWRGAGGGLRGDDMTGTVNRYDTYYRNANRIYLEKVNREGRKWAE